jgi:hypothetical protein
VVHRARTAESLSGLYRESCAIVLRHYRRPLTVAVVARALASSPRQVQRAFGEVGETSFSAYLPYVVGRVAKMKGNAQRPLMDILRSQFYTDTVSTTPAAVNLAIDVYGRDCVLFATDVPFEDMGTLRAFVEDNASPEDAEAILRRSRVPGLLDGGPPASSGTPGPAHESAR